MAKAFRYALKHSLPILISYIPVALAYGVLMQNCGYNFVWTGACSIFVLAGSLQYLMVTFFAGGVSLLTVAIMSLLLNSRHIFYGLSFIEKFRTFGPWKYFLIYSLTDENYSLHCSHHFESDVNEKWAYVLTAFLSIYILKIQQCIHIFRHLLLKYMYGKFHPVVTSSCHPSAKLIIHSSRSSVIIINHLFLF